MWQPTLIKLVDYVQNFGSFMCRYVQRVLIGVVLVLLGLFAYLFLQDIFSNLTINTATHHNKQSQQIKALTQKRSNTSIKILFLCIGVFLFYNLVYNYVMANLVGPGNPINIPSPILDKNLVTKKCRKCQGRKPIRTHHCSVCNKCTLQMDHHCPWLGTCIGHFNRRYFIRFLTYLSLVCFLFVQEIVYYELPRSDKYIFMLTIGIIIGLFGAFHWFIALWGRGTLQVCEIFDGYVPSQSVCTNFQIIFGTRNILLAMMPYYIPLTYYGCQWNKQSYSRISGIQYEQGNIQTLPNNV